MKKVGQPTASASPWSDRNVSVMRSRAAAGTAESSADMVPSSVAAVVADALEAGFRLGGGWRIRELLDHARECRARGPRMLELGLAEPDLQERIRRLAVAGIVFQQAIECSKRCGIVAPHVVRLTQPVHRVWRQLVLRVLCQEILQSDRCLVVLAVLHQAESSLVLRFRSARWHACLGC